MALKPRKNPDEVLFAMVAANNQRMVDAISTSFHLDRTAATPTLTTGGDYRNPVVARLSVTLAAATDSATQIALTNELRRVVNIHFADSIAHDTVTSAAITIAVATDQTSAWALANDIKSKYGTHLAAASVHFTNDGTNTIAAANATDATTLQVLANELRTDLTAHMASAPVGVYVDMKDA
jgi:hypothetical protein